MTRASLPLGVMMVAHRVAEESFVKDIGASQQVMINWTLSGSVLVRQVDGAEHCQAGRIFCNPPGLPFRYRVLEGPWECRWLVLDGLQAEQMLRDHELPRFFDGGDCPVDDFRRLEEELRQPDAAHQYRAIGTALRIYYRALGASKQGPAAQGLADRVRACIAEHFSDSSFNVAALATIMDVDRCSLARSLKRDIDRSPLELLTEYRIAAARELLRSDHLSVSEVAKACGFSHVDYFCRVFKRVTGQTAGDFRSGG